MRLSSRPSGRRLSKLMWRLNDCWMKSFTILTMCCSWMTQLLKRKSRNSTRTSRSCFIPTSARTRGRRMPGMWLSKRTKRSLIHKNAKSTCASCVKAANVHNFNAKSKTSAASKQARTHYPNQHSKTSTRRVAWTSLRTCRKKKTTW